MPLFSSLVEKLKRYSQEDVGNLGCNSSQRFGTPLCYYQTAKLSVVYINIGTVFYKLQLFAFCLSLHEDCRNYNDL